MLNDNGALHVLVLYSVIVRALSSVCRSVTIESNTQPSSAQQCATLNEDLPAGSRSLLAKVSLASDMPINGDIYLWQAAYPDGSHSDTKLVLQGLRGSTSVSQEQVNTLLGYGKC